MTQTAEERKIKRLEAQVKSLKEQLEFAEQALRRKESEVRSEREWRRDFQRLLKEVVLDDTVENYQGDY